MDGQVLPPKTNLVGDFGNKAPTIPIVSHVVGEEVYIAGVIDKSPPYTGVANRTLNFRFVADLRARVVQHSMKEESVPSPLANDAMFVLVNTVFDLDLLVDTAEIPKLGILDINFVRLEEHVGTLEQTTRRYTTNGNVT